MGRPLMLKPARRRYVGLAIQCASAGLALVGVLLAGCANDPVSQNRIKRRNAAVDRRIKEIEKSESRHPARLESTMQDISRDRERKKVQYRETMRTIGDRFW
jgi:hypothetical protein